MPQTRRNWLATALAFGVMLALPMLFSSSRSQAADEPVDKQVQAVVAAAGGEEKLLRLFRFSERVLITSTVTPLKPEDKSNRTSVVEVGTRWWVGKNLRDKDKVRVLCYAWSLRMLLDPKSKIATLEETSIGDRAAFGLRVTEVVKEPIDLYFDKQDQRLLAIDYTDTRHIFSEWKKTDEGHSYPSHVVGFRFADKAARKLNDKQWYQTDLLELTPLKELPPDVAT